MATQVQNRRGTTAEHSTFTGANGELTVDTTKRTLVVHDGATAGGRPLLREDQSNLPTSAPTTGIYNASGSLAISTGGSGRLFIGANPHVGVGITPNASSASSQVLEVGPSTFSSINNDCYQGANWFYTGAAYVYKNSAAASQYIQGGGEHIWTTASSGTAGNAITFSERLRITSTGTVNIVGAGSAGSTQAVSFNGSAPINSLVLTSGGLVGVGTSSPSEALHVVGNGRIGNNTTNPTFTVVSSNTGNPGANTRVGTFKFAANANNVSDITAERNCGITATTGSDERLTNLDFYTSTVGGGAPRVRIDSSGNVGIGSTQVRDSARFAVSSGETAETISLRPGTGTANLAEILCYNYGTTSYIPLRSIASEWRFEAGAGERARIDSSGRLLVGTSSARTVGEIVGGTTYTHQPQFQLESPNNSLGLSLITNRSADSTGPFITLGKSRGNALGGVTVVQNGDELGNIYFAGADGIDIECIGAAIFAEVDGTPGANNMPGRLVFSTTAAGASSPTERMRITNAGQVDVYGSGTQGFLLAQFGSNYPARVYEAGAAGQNNAATQLNLHQNSATGRSINAAGTINASGADYAEYMVKASDFTIAKGAVCGVTADGLLTLNYADAVSFVVKSTNPSYVGGDTWGSEDVVGSKPEADDADALVQWEADLEASRQAVDRIAFAGQVPVNVMGATPGQYIVPVEAADGGIEGVAKNETDMTLAEYMRAVGKVIAIEDDGRARIIVKVA